MRRLVPLAQGSQASHPEAKRDSGRRVRDPLASSASSCHSPSFPQHICSQESPAFPLFSDPSIFLPSQKGWCFSAAGAKARSVSELSQPGPAEASSKSEPFGAGAQVPAAWSPSSPAIADGLPSPATLVKPATNRHPRKTGDLKKHLLSGRNWLKCRLV